MLFQELIQRTDGKGVMRALEGLLYDESESDDALPPALQRQKYSVLGNYLKLFEELKTHPAVTERSNIHVCAYPSWTMDFEGNTAEYVEVTGYDYEAKERHELEYDARPMWLSYSIVKESANELGDDVYLAHCLLKMTTVSFSDEEKARRLMQIQMLKEEGGADADYLEDGIPAEELFEDFDFFEGTPEEQEAHEAQIKENARKTQQEFYRMLGITKE